MRTKTGSAFLNALAVQRRRMQQGFQNSPDVGPAREIDILADVGELTIFSDGARGADVDLTRRDM